MKNLHIEKTKKHPEVIFSEDGMLNISGRSYSENPVEFYDPLVKWCNDFNKEKLILDLKFDFLNTASSKCIFELIRSIELNNNIKEKIVNWHYELDDEDLKELGEILESSYKTVSFNYYVMDAAFI